MTAAFLGIDGGGTRTRGLLVSETGETLGEAEGGPCNWTSLAFDVCLHSIDIATSFARAREDLEVRGLCLCSSGFYPPHHSGLVLDALRERWPHTNCRAETDLMAAWAGALALQPGVVLVAGTGSVAFGRVRRGDAWIDARAGGWGPLIGDEGSSYWLVRAALAAVARAEDGRGEPTALAESMRLAPEHGALATGEWLREVLKGRPGREDLAALAPAVLAAYEAGDTVAVPLVREAAAELAAAAAAVERRLAQHDGGNAMPWSWAGGLLEETSVVRELVRDGLASAGSRLIASPPRLSASWGAALLAAEGCGEGVAAERMAAEVSG